MALQARKINAKDAHQALQAKDLETYLDVRTPEEFATGHAPGAVNVPVQVYVAGQRQPNPDFVEQVKAAIPNPHAPLCVACGGGGRGEAAAVQLLAAGYTGVHHLEEGFKGWRDTGLPVHQPGQQ